MSQVTEQSVRFQTALASIKLIQASAVLDLTEDDFDFLTRSEERFSRNAETDIVCRLLLEKKKKRNTRLSLRIRGDHSDCECPSDMRVVIDSDLYLGEYGAHAVHSR